MVENLTNSLLEYKILMAQKILNFDVDKPMYYK